MENIHRSYGMSEQNQNEIKKNSTQTPIVFISHDTRDAELAELFSNLLKSVSAGVLKSFRSSDKRGGQGIEYGVEWYPEIIKNIQISTDVVCLLTEQSINRPWILFEAGMAKGKLDTPILGLSLGIPLTKVSTGPFAQFQNCADDEDSLTKLVTQLVNRIPGSEPDADTIRFQVGKFRENLKKVLDKSKTSEMQTVERQTTVQENDVSSAKLFEEIKVMFQDLPARIDRGFRQESPRRRRKLHPGMIEEILHLSPNPTIGIKMALGLYKERFPWIYDEGIALVKRFEKTNVHVISKKSIMEFEEMIMMTTHHPFFREIFCDSEEDYIFVKELPRMIMRQIERLSYEDSHKN